MIVRECKPHFFTIIFILWLRCNPWLLRVLAWCCVEKAEQGFASRETEGFRFACLTSGATPVSIYFGPTCRWPGLFNTKSNVLVLSFYFKLEKIQFAPLNYSQSLNNPLNYFLVHFTPQPIQFGSNYPYCNLSFLFLHA